MFVQKRLRTKLSLESGEKKGPSATLGRLGSTVLHVGAESACSEIAFELFCRIVLHLIVTCKQPVTCLHESKVMIAPVYIKETCAFQVLLTTQVWQIHAECTKWEIRLRKVNWQIKNRQHIDELIKHKPSCHMSRTRVLAAIRSIMSHLQLHQETIPELLVPCFTRSLHWKVGSASVKKERHMFRLQSRCRHCIRPCAAKVLIL